MTDKNTQFSVDHDKDKCALCVVCARNCPTGALRRDEEGENLALYFNASRCDGCEGNALCEQNCPEKAIVSVSDAKETDDNFVLLSQSKMAQCEYCDEYFAPIRRLDVISTKTDNNDIQTRFCPLCRRTSLVVDFIEKYRAPGQKAEYRSARDITRRANKRMKAEEQTSRRR